MAGKLASIMSKRKSKNSMKNLLIGMVLLGSAAVLSNAHAADPAAASGNGRFMRLSSGDATGGVYSISANRPVQFISLDRTPRMTTESKAIPLHGAEPAVRPLRAAVHTPAAPKEEVVEETTESTVVTTTVKEPNQAASAPYAMQHQPVNARRETVVAQASASVEPAPSMARIPAVSKEPVLPLVRQHKATPLVPAKSAPNLDAAFASVEDDFAEIKPEVVVSDMSAVPTQTEVVIRDAEKLIASSEAVMDHSQAVPVETVSIADLAPAAGGSIKGMEQPKTIVLADASPHSVEPWEKSREVTGTEREFMLDRSVKRASKQVQAIAEEEQEADLHETIESAPDDEEITNVSLDDEYIPESASGAAALAVTPSEKPDAPHTQGRTGGKDIAFQWPVRGGDQKISSSFGSRKHPVTGKRHFHTGIDIPAPRGTAVLAAADGDVTEVGSHPRLGKFIKIDHGNGVYSIYGHLDRYMVRKGKHIDAGTRIGSVGSTGRSTGPHLHFTINRNGKLQNPMVVLRDSKASNSLALAKPE